MVSSFCTIYHIMFWYIGRYMYLTYYFMKQVICYSTCRVPILYVFIELYILYCQCYNIMGLKVTYYSLWEIIIFRNNCELFEFFKFLSFSIENLCRHFYRISLSSSILPKSWYAVPPLFHCVCCLSMFYGKFL